MVGAPGSRGGWGVAETASRIRCRYALVAQWIEHLTTDQKVVGSTPAERTISLNRVNSLLGDVTFLLKPCVPTLEPNNGGVVGKFGAYR
jgi:hypothetical protein